MSVDSDKFVTLGYVSGLFGVRGWIKLFSYTRPRQNIFSYNPWYLKTDSGWKAVEVVDGRDQGKGLVALLDGYSDRDLAAGLLNCEIAIQRDQMDDLEEDEYYWTDLVGLEVINADGRLLGTVVDMMETGSNDVMVIRGEKQHLIPFVPDVWVSSVDLEAGRLYVDWQEPE